MLEYAARHWDGSAWTRKCLLHDAAAGRRTKCCERFHLALGFSEVLMRQVARACHSGSRVMWLLKTLGGLHGEFGTDRCSAMLSRRAECGVQSAETKYPRMPIRIHVLRACLLREAHTQHGVQQRVGPQQLAPRWCLSAFLAWRIERIATPVAGAALSV